ncbi:MAG: DnaJ domain-containing protein, partial [Myxococcales bacterium]|nr:DnaJ domain-containing protein [Myxococcales bacterium]
KLPDAGSLDATDLRIIETMRMPRRLDQIWPLTRTPRFRLLCFIHFLRAIGAVHEQGVATSARPRIGTPARQSEAMRTLGLKGLAASPQDVKRAYRHLARTLHPDLNHAQSHAHRRASEQRLADVNSAYRELMQSR